MIYKSKNKTDNWELRSFIEHKYFYKCWIETDCSSPTNCDWHIVTWAAPSEFGTYRLREQRRFRQACASAQSRQNLRCSLIQAVNQEKPSDRKPDPWLLWMAGHAQLKFVMTECSKTQIRLTGLTLWRSMFWLSLRGWFNVHASIQNNIGERGGSVVECRTPEREVGGSKPTAAVLCPWARHFTPRKYWLITQEAVARSRHDWKIVDWDVKPQHKQTNSE